MENLWPEILKQSPLFITMCVVIWWLQKRYVDKDLQLENLAKGFVEISTKWQDWIQAGHNSNKDEAERIMQKLEEIKRIVENR